MKRLKKITQTSAMAIDVLAKSLPGKIYNLAAGDPDLPVCRALEDACRSNDPGDSHRYGSSQGDPQLRAKLRKNPAEVILANGAKQLIYMALAAVTRPGDTVVLIGPCWASYMKICELLGLRCTLAIGEKEEHFVPSAALLETLITPETAAVLINNPNNPTGVVYPEDYMCSLLNLVRKNDTYLISDEVYRYLADPQQVKLVPTLRGEKNVITIDGFSKCLNITGWRLGYAIASAELIETMTGIQSQISGPPNTMIQKIVCDAWENLQFTDYEAYRKRMELLGQLENFRPYRPRAGFYYFLPIADHWKNSRELCEYMLKEHCIAVTPGDDYGVERTVRVSAAAVNEEDLREILAFLLEI